MKTILILLFAIGWYLTVPADEQIPMEIRGEWQSPIRKKLKWDQPYESVYIMVLENGKCPLILSPPNYGVVILLELGENRDEYFYRVHDQGKLVEEGILRYNRVADTLTFSLFDEEVHLVRSKKLLEREP